MEWNFCEEIWNDKHACLMQLCFYDIDIAWSSQWCQCMFTRDIILWYNVKCQFSGSFIYIFAMPKLEGMSNINMQKCGCMGIYWLLCFAAHSPITRTWCLKIVYKNVLILNQTALYKRIWIMSQSPLNIILCRLFHKPAPALIKAWCRINNLYRNHVWHV